MVIPWTTIITFTCLVIIMPFIVVNIMFYIGYESTRDKCVDWGRNVNANGYNGQTSLLTTCMETNNFYVDYWQNWIDRPHKDTDTFITPEIPNK